MTQMQPQTAAEQQANSQAEALTPINAVTGKEYQNSNKERLQNAALAKAYTSSEWATMRQWNALGKTVAKGEKGTAIMFFEQAEAKDGTPTKVHTRAYVFNRNQLAVKVVDTTQ